MLNFQIERPRSVSEALALLSEAPDDTVLYAGGTELILAMKEGMVEAARLVDVKGIDSLGGISEIEGGGGFAIGARVTHREVLRSEQLARRIPILPTVISQVANVRVRSAGTLVGNLCFAEPHSDVAVVSSLLEATVHIGGETERQVPVEDFILGPYGTVLENTEIVKSLNIPLPATSSYFGYDRMKGTERPLVAVGVRLDVVEQTTVDARVIVGAAGPSLWRSDEVDRSLVGIPVSELAAALPTVAHQIAVNVDADDDYEASEDYRRHLAGEAFMRASMKALSEGGTL